MVLNMGTNNKSPTPIIKVKRLCFFETLYVAFVSLVVGRSTFPFIVRVIAAKGTNIDINDGMNVSMMILLALT